MKRVLFLLPYFFIVFSIGVFFYKTILYGLLPVPTDSLVGLYHPWRDLYAATNPRGVPFKNFLITDPVRQQIPWRKIAIDQWKIREIPAWNPYNFLGVPMAANIQAGIYQPINVLFGFLDFPNAWTLVIVLQPLFGALFLYLYLKNLSLSTTSAYVGAMVWAFCGFSIAWLTWGTIGWVALCIPLILYAIDRVVPHVLWSIGIGLVLVFMVVSGHVQIALYGLGISFFYAIYRMRRVRKKEVFLFILFSTTILLIGSYPVWKPFIQFYLSTARSNATQLSTISGWLMPASHLIQFVVPDFFGNPATLNYYGVWNYGEFIGYIGIIPLIFALSSLFIAGVSMFWSWVGIISLLLMIDSPLTHALYSLQIPIFSSLQPTRLIVLVDLSLAILTAFGLEAFITHKTKRLYVSYGIIAFLFLLLCLIVTYVSRTSSNAETITNLAVATRNLFIPLTLLCVLGALFLIQKIYKKSVTTIVVACIVLFSLVDLFRFGWKFTPFTPKEYFFPQTKVISFLQAQPKPFRVMSMDDRILPPNVSGYYGIETIEGYDPLYPIDYASFLYGDQKSSIALQRIFTLHDLDNPALPYLNVRYVLSLSLIDNPNFVKVFEEGETKVYQYTKSLDRVYIKNALANEFSSIEYYSDNKLTIITSTISSRVLVILNRYDRGWTTTIDGTKAPIFKVNSIFQGIEVPEGKHTVELSYRPL